MESEWQTEKPKAPGPWHYCVNGLVYTGSVFQSHKGLRYLGKRCGDFATIDGTVESYHRGYWQPVVVPGPPAPYPKLKTLGQVAFEEFHLGSNAMWIHSLHQLEWERAGSAILTEAIRRGQVREVKPVTEAIVEEAWDVFCLSHGSGRKSMRAVLEKFAK